MNLGITILGVILIIVIVFWAWYKLKDTREGDMIDVGFGTHVERWAFEMRIAFALAISLFLLAIGLLSTF